MADPTEPDAGDATSAAEPDDTVGASPSAGGRRRTLDRRTVAICAVLGVIAAIVTVLAASAFTSSGDDTSGAMVLEDPVDSQKVLAQPLETLDGEQTDLAEIQDGKPMLVNIWQSTCSKCVYEMPLLNDAQAANPDVDFLGIATQEPSLADAKALAKQTGITYPWVLDDMGGVFYEAEGQGMPTTILISASGSVVDTKSGDFTSAKELQAFIDQAG